MKGGARHVCGLEERGEAGAFHFGALRGGFGLVKAMRGY